MGYVQDLQQKHPSFDLGPALRAAQRWGAVTTALEQRSEGILAASHRTRRQRRLLRAIDAALVRQERHLTTPAGLAGRPWFKHQVYAPGRYTCYAAQFLPAIEDALEANDLATARRYTSLLAGSLNAAAADAARACGCGP